MFVLAAAGCGAAGALELISQPFVQPTAAFSVQWTAEMIFACLIGGIGTIEGPILGTIVFFALQQWLANYGTWYFIVLGVDRDRRGHLGAARPVGPDLRAAEHPAVPGRLPSVARRRDGVPAGPGTGLRLRRPCTR